MSPQGGLGQSQLRRIRRLGGRVGWADASPGRMRRHGVCVAWRMQIKEVSICTHFHVANENMQAGGRCCESLLDFLLWFGLCWYVCKSVSLDGFCSIKCLIWVLKVSCPFISSRVFEQWDVSDSLAEASLVSNWYYSVIYSTSCHVCLYNYLFDVPLIYYSECHSFFCLVLLYPEFHWKVTIEPQ